MTDDDGVAKVRELIKDIKFCMITTTADDGRLLSRPMAVQQVEFDGDLWFFVERHGRLVAQIERSPAVNVSFSSSSSWVSMAGNAAVVDDRAKAKELWNSIVEAWFPEGPEDPDIVLIKVSADSAEYWDTPGGRVATLFSFVKAKVTGQPYDGGENERVEV